jgi:hypothetical protein
MSLLQASVKNNFQKYDENISQNWINFPEKEESHFVNVQQLIFS